MRIINDWMRLWPAENDPVLAGAADATKREGQRGVIPAGVLVPLDVLARWAVRTGAGAAKLMTGREVTAAAITAALASEPGE